ncbi:ricin-type beta-trefoil lectin domain protein [Kitasatospora azatica]|uniref:ricin-type beta-trefoil lectin domain protein n=1 Tax=Kitasatospora azatica TaxID=58347 RepID=UPI00056C5F3C|nr:ricin-type beta-trefoil lectin domain protein [Kitasatospora azatica]
MRGFSKLTLQPGQSTAVTFALTPSDLAVWSTADKNWTTPGGTYQVFVGDSARRSDLPLHATFTLSGADPTGETVAGVAANLCVDNKWGSTQDGNPITLHACNGTDAQKVAASSDGTLRIQGKCIDVVDGGTDNKTLVQLWSCTTDNPDQQWVPQPNGALRNPRSNRCLDDPGATLTQGTRLQIYDCNGSAAQRWRIP